MKYEVIQYNNLYELIDAVNNYIENGWKPLGGIAVTSCGSYNIEKRYLQAMIKEEKKEEKIDD